MNLQQLYEFAIQKGMEVDPRGRESLQERLRDVREEYEELSEKDRASFDLERLSNPFGDTRIVCGDTTTEVRRAMVGIDIEGQEILAAKMLSDQGTRVDAILAHHATALGRPLASVYDTVCVQVHMMTEVGVPLHVAEKVINADAGNREPGENYRHAALAELLGVSILGVHTPTDNYGLCFTRALVAEQQPAKVKDLTELLAELPECKDSLRKGIPPKALVGAPKDSLGDRLYYCLTGGWNPTPTALKKIAEAGVGTVVMVSATGEHEQLARDHHMNLVRFPHYPFDSLGINLLLDDLNRESPLDVVPCSNFTRVERG
ncbi:MAG: hypothetical protein COZ06_07795 [Armatimonadetes bacterium CG_4_10_14_3_um_filter_66_18]|nr:hypothetical protein [Armatimonadota bacterium]OIO93360.1 MAG: hypothetical protein AUJ96_30505 [Armatimonadetes bacterium CG2_30_66_41]PIU92226.1 MAG: hypothetical protein COS65_19020 [Armatimonadetes bacterium CG06_land_8_20_14_3_00_66_21]PIW20336.1 MAG: hypothetical protein COW34_02090 [Armatimonadetes bacterium CG17_big_fil_post_rev_8_21_14_2_50_66_6]PIX40564.1 MAG: hypothetical protein COZ57_25610 [Armatimonadetes bacterium CG_4_8_14_3_um_filter_66_20]PIY50750.1 MAG: hypothetical prote